MSVEARRPQPRGILAANMLADTVDEMTMLDIRKGYFTRLSLSPSGPERAKQLTERLNEIANDLNELGTFAQYLESVIGEEVAKVKKAEAQAN